MKKFWTRFSGPILTFVWVGGFCIWILNQPPRSVETGPPEHPFGIPSNK